MYLLLTHLAQESECYGWFWYVPVHVDYRSAVHKLYLKTAVLESISLVVFFPLVIQAPLA